MSWDVWGHEWAEALLKKHIAGGLTRHAYLFTGAPGIGRRTLALAFIKALYCQNPPEPGEFCGSCRSCKQLDKLQHTDLFIGQAAAPGETLKIDTVREIQHNLNMQPYAAPWRTALFLRFEEANLNAQNALLKTLEEPTPLSKLMLTASNENALLPTISSRCEVIRLRPMVLQALAEKLQTARMMLPEEALRIAHLAGGRPGYALHLADNPDEIERILSIASDGADLLSEDTLQRFAYAAAFKDVKKRPVLRETLQIWQSLFRDLLLLSASGDTSDQPLSFLDLRDKLASYSAKGSPELFRKTLSEINRMITYLNANTNLQLLAENLLLNFPNL
jgi:DNA polymerase-3 subunit delta'